MVTKETKGITIVSLVVTIVVLLILASVTVNVLFGDNGVVKNVSARQYTAYEKIAKEEVKKLTMEYDIANSGETLEEYLNSKVPERIEEVTRKDDNTLIVKKNGYEIEVESENRILIFDIIPYVGIYDGKTHNILSNVNVSPSDAKIEYSTDGGKTYVDKMPTIINASSVQVTVKASKMGYKTETVTKIAIVNKAEGKVTLSATNGTITYPDSTTFTASGNTGNLSVSSNSTNIATASLSGSNITVKSGTKAGKATITVTSAENANYNEKSAAYTATVQNGTISLGATPYTGTYDGKAHNAITKVTVNPSDAKIDYSTDGTNYSTTMPTVTNSSSFTVTVRASKAGYKTQTTTQTVKVNKADGKLTLSATSGTYTYPTSGTFTVSGNTGTLSAVSNNTNIATVTVSGNTVTVKSVGVGSATITVKSASNTNYNEKTATYSVTVKYQTFTGNSGVGYYADTDGDGTPDGIIFADFKNGGSGSWGGTNYTISTVTGLKEYYISQTNYNGPFGTKNVLSARGSGNSRFNVMALSDYNNSSTYAFANAQSITSGEWKTPTIATWSTFAGQLKITNSNYGEYGLERIYWSSTAFTGFGSNHSYYISFYAVMSNGIEARSNKYPVRLVRTF